MQLIKTNEIHPLATFLAKLSEGSRKTVLGQLDRIADSLDRGATAQTLNWSELRYQHVAVIRAALVRQMAPSTVNGYLSAIRGIISEYSKMGLMDRAEAEQIMSIENVKNERIPAGRAISPIERAALFASCDESNKGIRDAAIFALLYASGIRCSELCALDVVDWNPSGRSLAIRYGKGDKQRVVYLSRSAADRVDRWIEVRGEGGIALFLSMQKGDKITDSRITPQGIRKICADHGSRTGIAPFTPHDLRRTMVGDLLDAGVDVATVADVVGHSQVQTTLRYDRRGERRKRTAADRLQVPA